VVSDRQKAKLLGVGLDNDDGQVRLTRGKNFELVGGSEQTHASMQEKCIKFNEKLDAKGKALESLERQEFLDMAAECRMNVVVPRREKS
jgi:methylase of polypeptide subunit release factors